jgi:hypothetical protein
MVPSGTGGDKCDSHPVRHPTPAHETTAGPKGTPFPFAADHTIPASPVAPQSMLRDTSHANPGTRGHSALSALVSATQVTAAFSVGDPAATLFNVLYRQPSRPAELVPMPSDVELVLALGLAKAPEARFARADELAVALGDAMERRLAAGIRARGAALLAEQPWGEAVPAEP